MNLILITQSYPYSEGGELTFVNQELPYLSNSFEEVFIVPQYRGGGKANIQYSNIRVIEEFISFKTPISYKKSIMRLLNYDPSILKIIFREILKKPRILFNVKQTLIMLVFISQSYEFKKWIEKFIIQNKLNVSNCIFYSYWFQSTTTGLTLLRKKYPQIRIISRAHGVDLLEEQNRYNYLPFRAITLNTIDAVFTCMNSGAEYVKNKYKIKKLRVFNSYIGVDDLGFINSPSTDGILRIVTCSTIDKNKRLDLLILGLQEWLKIKSNNRIRWLHFGDGELRNEIQQMAQVIIGKTIMIEIRGQVTLNSIIEYYKSNPVDVFINVSKSEGQPVSIKEAISFGIPVIATNVGGNSEIVTKTNGILLDANPSPQNIALAINWLINNQNKVPALRSNSRKLFLDRYDSRKVYPDFIEKIQNVFLIH